MFRFLCRNKSYRRVITADACPLLGCPPLGRFRPQSVDDGERFCRKLDSKSLHRGSKPNVTGAPAEPCDCCPSPLNLEGSSAAAEESCSWTAKVPSDHCRTSDRQPLNLERTRTVEDLSVAPDEVCFWTGQDLCDYCRTSDGPDPYKVVPVSSPCQVNRRSSGVGAILPQRRGSSISAGARWFSSDASRISSQLSREEEKASPFVVIQGDNTALLGRIDEAMKEKTPDFTYDALKERFDKYVKPQLRSRGLLLPEDLRHNTTKFVHFRTKDLYGRRPMYMSALDIMGHEKRMDPNEWQRFLKYMMKTRIYVIGKWDSISHVESLMYDYGIIAPDDGSDVEFFKGECDASFAEKNKVANLAFLIFKGKRIIRCQVYYDVPCETSVIAEAYAALALLMTSADMGIKKLVFWTDCKATHEVVSGESNLKLGDDNLGVFVMLREQKKEFDKVISMWKGREVNLFAEELATLDRKITLSVTFPLQAMERWKLQMEGSPVFRFKQKKEVTDIVKTFADDKTFGRSSANSALILDVEMVCKFDILVGLEEGFEPDDLYVAVHDFDKKPQIIKSRLAEFFGKPESFGENAIQGASYFHKSRSDKKADERKSMMVVFDAHLWGKSFHNSHLTVVLRSPEDAESVAQPNLKTLTAVHYVRFNLK